MKEWRGRPKKTKECSRRKLKHTKGSTHHTAVLPLWSCVWPSQTIPCPPTCTTCLHTAQAPQRQTILFFHHLTTHSRYINIHISNKSIMAQNILCLLIWQEDQIKCPASPKMKTKVKDWCLILNKNWLCLPLHPYQPTSPNMPEIEGVLCHEGAYSKGDVIFVDFIYLVLTSMLGNSYHRRLKFLLLSPLFCIHMSAISQAL